MNGMNWSEIYSLAKLHGFPQEWWEGSKPEGFFPSKLIAWHFSGLYLDEKACRLLNNMTNEQNLFCSWINIFSYLIIWKVWTVLSVQFSIFLNQPNGLV